MSKCKGTVSGCGKGKFSYFITLEEKEGFYFNTKYEPKCGKGDVVGIEYMQKAENRGNVQKVKVIESNSNGYEDTSQSYSSNSGGGAAPSGGRQDSIVWQSSRKDALVFVGMLLANDGFALKGKTDAKRTQLEELVDEVTFTFFAAASDPKASNAYATNAEVEEDAAEDEGKAESKGDDAWDDEWDD